MPDLADRVRTVLAGQPVTERRMFGGICFMLNGNMLAAASAARGLMLRVGKDHDAAELARAGARPMVHGGRTMTGFVYVDPAAIADEDGLRHWLGAALRHVAALPPKVKEPAKRGRRKA